MKKSKKIVKKLEKVEEEKAPVPYLKNISLKFDRFT